MIVINILCHSCWDVTASPIKKDVTSKMTSRWTSIFSHFDQLLKLVLKIARCFEQNIWGYFLQACNIFRAHYIIYHRVIKRLHSGLCQMYAACFSPKLFFFWWPNVSKMDFDFSVTLDPPPLMLLAPLHKNSFSDFQKNFFQFWLHSSKSELETRLNG